MFGLVFLATPGFLTAIGCLLVGLAYPAACSAALLGRPDAFAAQVSTADSQRTSKQTKNRYSLPLEKKRENMS